MKKLTLDTSKLSPKKKKEVKDLKKLTKKPHLDVPITLEDIKKTVKWLCKTYPLLFSEKRHLPLKTGIEKDIFEKEADKLVFSRTLVRKAIGCYVNHKLYLKNIIEGNLRYDLTGKEAGSIEKGHKEAARKNLDSKKKKN